MDNKEIIEEIKKKEIKMRPRWHFILRSILIIALGIIISIIALYLLSFILFSFRPFPWLPFVFLLIFIISLEYLLKELKIVYRKPIIYSLLIIIFLLFMLGSVLNRVNFHERMERRNLPGTRQFYKRYPKRIIEKPNFEIKRIRRL